MFSDPRVFFFFFFFFNIGFIYFYRVLPSIEVEFDISILWEEWNSGSDEVAIPLGSNKDSKKTSLPSQAPASIPLVPLSSDIV